MPTTRFEVTQLRTGGAITHAKQISKEICCTRVIAQGQDINVNDVAVAEGDPVLDKMIYISGDYHIVEDILLFVKNKVSSHNTNILFGTLGIIAVPEPYEPSLIADQYNIDQTIPPAILAEERTIQITSNDNEQYIMANLNKKNIVVNPRDILHLRINRISDGQITPIVPNNLVDFLLLGEKL